MKAKEKRAWLESNFNLKQLRTYHPGSADRHKIDRMISTVTIFDEENELALFQFILRWLVLGA